MKLNSYSLSESEEKEGKRLWQKYNHRTVLAKASSSFLTPNLISFYDLSYWDEFLPTQQRQLLETMREMELKEKGVCLQCHGHGKGSYMVDNDYNNNYDEVTCSKCNGTGKSE